MKHSFALGITLIIGLVGFVGGCGFSGPGGGDLDNLTVDANNNGFPDIDAPEGVVFDEVTNLKLRLSNSITEEDVGAIAEQQGVDASLLNFVTIVANLTVTLDYGVGEPQVLNESESIELFEKKMELACPDTAQVDVGVVANVPIVGAQDITEFSVVLTEGVDYECGQTIEVESFVDANGNPAVDYDIN